MDFGDSPWPNSPMRSRRWVSGVAIVACLVAPMAARAADAQPASTRAGDNTIYLKWSAERREAVTATSSLRMVAGQRVSLTTGMADRTGRLRMTARFANLSRRTSLSLQGTFVHVVTDDADNVVKTIEEPVSVVLLPGERTAARFAYSLDSGWYSITTSFKSD